METSVPTTNPPATDVGIWHLLGEEREGAGNINVLITT